jgi:hypothetical protein
MREAAIKRLEEEADQIYQELLQLFTEMERTPVEECGRFEARFVGLTRRHGMLGQKAIDIGRAE